MSYGDDTLLKVDRLTMRYGNKVAVDDLSFSAVHQDITAIVGPEDAGKTVVFNCITGISKPMEGKLTLTHTSGDRFMLERMYGKNIVRKAKIGRVFHNTRRFGGMTLLDSLLAARGNMLMRFLSSRSTRRKAADKARALLDRIGLLEYADRPASGLSLGNRRRLEIARAMFADPVLLCIDEPCAGLEPEETAALTELLVGIRGDTDTSILLTARDMDAVAGICDHVIVLDQGKKICDGTALQARNDPAVIAAYAGIEGGGDTADAEAAGKPKKKPRAVSRPAAKPKPASTAATATPKPEKKAKPQRRPRPKKPTAAELRREEAVTAARLAKLPEDATPLDKANAVGRKPRSIPQARKEGADDLMRIKGIGPANTKKLNELGIWHFDQIATWDRPQIRWVSTYLSFPGRIDREDWVRQAHTLAEGRQTAFSRRIPMAGNKRKPAGKN